MAVLKRKDIGRLGKIYPFSRRKPRTKFISDQEGIIETGKIEVTTPSDQFSYIFKENYSLLTADPVICLGVYSATNEIYTASVTLINMTAQNPMCIISTSAVAKPGDIIYIQIMEFKSSWRI